MGFDRDAASILKRKERGWGERMETREQSSICQRKARSCTFRNCVAEEILARKACHSPCDKVNLFSYD